MARTTKISVSTDKTVFDMIKEVTNEGYEDPFYVVDLGDIVYKYKVWKDMMPRVQPYYAVKCNDSPIIIDLLTALGTGFDCASKGEIDAVLKAGGSISQIIYANPCKTSAFIKHAASVGVDLMTFDNELELYKVKKIFPHARLVLRIRVDDSSAICQLGVKFGANVEDAPHLLKVAKDLDLNVVGISFHVGSGCQDANAYTMAIESCSKMFTLGEELGFQFTLLDIGGGFPGFKGTTVTFEEIATVVNQGLEKYFPVSCGVQIIAEPGRYFVASAFTLSTNIIAKRILALPNEQGVAEDVSMYYVNDGVYGSFNCLIFDHAEVLPIPYKAGQSKSPSGTLCKSSIWGPTCDSMDRILETCHLPQLDIGDWILFENMGAYTMAAASKFNGFEKPSMKFILPLPLKVYLEQLPGWSKLSTILDTNDPFGKENIMLHNSHHLPLPEAVFA